MNSPRTPQGTPQGTPRGTPQRAGRSPPSPLTNERITYPTPSPDERKKRAAIFEEITGLKLTPYKGGTTSVMFFPGNRAVKFAMSDVRNKSRSEEQLLNELELAIKAGELGLGPKIDENKSSVVKGSDGEYYLILFMKKLKNIPKNKNYSSQIQNIHDALLRSGINVRLNNHPEQYMIDEDGYLQRLNYGRAKRKIFSAT